MAEETNSIDWRAVRSVLLRRKQVEFAPELDELCKRHGVVLRAIIVPSNDGQFAQAKITVELAEQ